MLVPIFRPMAGLGSYSQIKQKKLSNLRAEWFQVISQSSRQLKFSLRDNNAKRNSKSDDPQLIINISSVPPLCLAVSQYLKTPLHLILTRPTHGMHIFINLIIQEHPIYLTFWNQMTWIPCPLVSSSYPPQLPPL